MERTKLLVLNASRGSDLAVSLRGVLAEANQWQFQIREELLSEHRTEQERRLVSRAVQGCQPNLVLLCFSDSALQQTEATFDLVREHTRGVPIVVVSPAREPEDLWALLKLGAADFLAPPLRSVDVLPRLWRLGKPASACDSVALSLKEKLGLGQLVGESPALLSEIKKVPAIARCDASVLIAGETGTGKEIFARAIHYLSARSGQAFTPVNCGAIPVDLVENELFGHEAGAFTGASGAAPGLVRETHGGTLFLDEIDCLPLLAQVKLLRLIQEKEFRPLGSQKTCKADVRIIAASNVNLERAVGAGRFRPDLYYRLNVAQLDLPPLRQRHGDIPLLARHFVGKYASELGQPEKAILPGALQRLMTHDWPGNVRELENVIERAMILSDRPVLGAEDILLPGSPAAPPADTSFRALKARTIEQFERAYIVQLLQANQGNITRAAQAAQKNRRAFWQLMRKYDIRAWARR